MALCMAVVHRDGETDVVSLLNLVEIHGQNDRTHASRLANGWREFFPHDTVELVETEGSKCDPIGNRGQFDKKATTRSH